MQIDRFVSYWSSFILQMIWTMMCLLQRLHNGSLSENVRQPIGKRSADSMARTIAMSHTIRSLYVLCCGWATHWRRGCSNVRVCLVVESAVLKWQPSVFFLVVGRSHTGLSSSDDSKEKTRVCLYMLCYIEWLDHYYSESGKFPNENRHGARIVRVSADQRAEIQLDTHTLVVKSSLASSKNTHTAPIYITDMVMNKAFCVNDLNECFDYP